MFPLIPNHLAAYWQGISQTLADILEVRAVLLWRFDEDRLELVAASNNAVFTSGDTPLLRDSGSYFEAQFQSQQELFIHDARQDDRWRDKIDANGGMVCYLGVPVCWPDKSPFGILCLVHDLPSDFSDAQIRLLRQNRDFIEHQLGDLYREKPPVSSGYDEGGDASHSRDDRFRLLVEQAADDYYLHDVKGRILDVNQQACRSTGYSRAELLEMGVHDLTDDLSQQEKQSVWEGMPPGATAVIMAHHRRKDGSIYPVEARITCSVVNDQKFFLGMVRDITERLAGERAIRQLNQELEQLVTERTNQWRKSMDLLMAVMDGATDAIFVKDLEGRFLFFNRAASNFVGREASEVIGMTTGELLGEAAAEKIREYELEVVRTGNAVTTEETIFMNASARVFLINRNPYRDETGQIIGIIGVSHDITEKVQAEKALRASEERWQFAVEGAGDGIWDWDVASEQIFFSPQCKAMLGYADDEINNATEDWAKLIHPDDFPLAQRAIDQCFTDTEPFFVIEHRMRASDDSWHWLLARGKVIERGDEDRPLRIIGTYSDITERKLREDEFRMQRERLALAAVVCRLGIWDYQIEANRLHCDSQWYQILGIDPSVRIETVEDFKPYIHPEDVKHATEVNLVTLQELLNSARDYRITFRVLRPDGSIRWVKSAACLLESENGMPSRAVGVIMDVTESHLAEERLRESYDSLRRAERMARIGSWTLDIVTSEFASSEMLCELNGADPNGPPVTVDNLQRMIAPESYRQLNAAISHCLQTGAPYGLEVEHLRPDGSSFAAYVQGQAHRDQAGHITHLSGTVQDITEIAEARERLKALADNLPNGAIYRMEYDREGQASMVYMSAGILLLVGLTSQEIIDDITTFTRMIHPEDLPRYRAAGERSLATGEPSHCRFRVTARGGRQFWLEYRAVISASRVDGSTIWDGILRDVTKEQQTAETLRNAKEIAESAERAKSQFLATMSHEIRTPMNTVLGMTRLMLLTELTPKQQNYLQKIDISARLLLSIINDILDLSKIEAGHLHLEDTEFSLDSLLETVATETVGQAEEKGLDFVYDIHPLAAHQLRGDLLRLCQVLVNLVVNAIKFTGSGEIVVSVTTAAEVDVNWMHFEVRDTGIGLDAEQLSGLFRPFAQAHPQIAHRYGGTGLGLTICKHIVEAMGGSIGVESAPGQGSTFRFSIPQPGGLEIAAATDSLPSVQLLKGRRALVIDDNDTARRVMHDMLTRFGLGVESVSSRDSATDAFHRATQNRQPFDFVLVDWRMPDMDRLEFARYLKGECPANTCQLLFTVTGYVPEEVSQDLESLGFGGIVSKPVIESVLLKQILAMTGDGATVNSTENLPSYADTPPPPHEAFPILRGRSVLVVDDNPLNREVATDFLTAVGMEVETAQHGIEAIQRLKERHFDAMLLDMHMPEMDGLTTVREIRRRKRWELLPIIALTARAQLEDRDTSLEAGLTAYLTKPIDEVSLYGVLADCLSSDGIRSSSAPLTRNAASSHIEGKIAPSDEPDILTPFDLELATKRLGNNPQRVRRLINGFVYNFSGIPDQMQLSLERGNAAEVAILAHMVRGTASYLEAHAFCDIAQELEEAAHRSDADAMRFYGARFVASLQLLLSSLNSIGEEKNDSGETDFPKALALLERASPFITQGDYSAQAYLDELSRLLKTTPLEELGEALRDNFENLELELAASMAQQLKSELQKLVLNL